MLLVSPVGRNLKRNERRRWDSLWTALVVGIVKGLCWQLWVAADDDGSSSRESRTHSSRPCGRGKGRVIGRLLPLAFPQAPLKQAYAAGDRCRAPLKADYCRRQWDRSGSSCCCWPECTQSLLLLTVWGNSKQCASGRLGGRRWVRLWTGGERRDRRGLRRTVRCDCGGSAAAAPAWPIPIRPNARGKSQRRASRLRMEPKRRGGRGCRRGGAKQQRGGWCGC